MESPEKENHYIEWLAERRALGTGEDARRSIASISRFRMASMLSGFICAGCGEWNETTVDESAGLRQRYVEDCQVCCKPNVLRISWEPDAEEFVIDTELE